ncbi:hypothetical protein [Paraburkholderia hayleyella]|uniref:hypothetical protein n=1 Tax=Paraburkholderia hayleyella TaxID=2152889 RepID=UPI001FE4F4CA|nr:hypothetical protein [Paraburkholderia hayleyella]
MNPPSERIVVIVTHAQKRAIAASAKHLGISVSELMRRAVLSFGATSEQVKVASMVDRLNAARAPDMLSETLRRVANHSHAVSAAEAHVPETLSVSPASGCTHQTPPIAAVTAAANEPAPISAPSAPSTASSADPDPGSGPGEGPFALPPER